MGTYAGHSSLTRGSLLVGAAALSFILAACDSKPPIAPGSTQTVVALDITGPPSVAPGQSAQYSLFQRLSDGSRRAVSNAQWNSNNPALLQVSESGLATAAALTGDATLQALVTDQAPNGPRLVSREILVLPDGTFRLVGDVRESGSGGFRVAGARLEARLDADLSAPVVTFATATPEGAYKLFGVPGNGFIHIRKAGYRSTTIPVQLAAHETRHFDIELDGQRPTFAGSYTMTIEAPGGSCGFSQPLPNDLRRRTYAADVAQQGPLLTVTLSGAPFAVARGSGDRFSGIVTDSGFTVELRSHDFYDYYPGTSGHPDVAEALADGTVLVPTGRAALKGSRSTGFSGNLIYVRQYSGPTFPGRFLAGCLEPKLTLTPR
jgi:hypothetical protein